MSITYDLDCGEEVITLELLDDGTLISYGFDIEDEMIAKEMGFEPHPCFAAMDKALWKAARGGDIDIVEILLAAGTNVGSDYYGFQLAAEKGYIDVVKILLEYGAGVHARENVAFRYAARNGHADIVKLLLKYGADVHARDDEALEWAAGHGHAEIVKLLFKHGADIYKCNRQVGHDGVDHDLLFWVKKYKYYDVLNIIEDWIKDHS